MFSKNEIRQIKKSIKIISKDIRELLKKQQYDEIIIPIKLQLPRKYGREWNLIINKRIIAAESDNYTNSIFYPFNAIHYDQDDYNAFSQIILQYDEIREKINNIVNENVEKKDKNIKKITDISNKYSSSTRRKEKKLEATVQIDMPDSINAQEIILTKEGTKKVGIIDFGAQTIKIITKGNIVLVNSENKDNKVKRK